MKNIQNRLKVITFLAIICVMLIFTVKYFYTTDRSFASLNYNANHEDLNPSEIPDQNPEEDILEDEESQTPAHNPMLDAFDYNEPISEQDPKALKKNINKKLSYSNYEDRIRMTSPAKLDANGLYVSLMQAVGDNDIERAKNLIERGAKLNSPDGDTSYAPIFWAISNGNVEMIDLLLQKGAKVNTPDEKGFFPIHWIVEQSASRPQVYQMKAIFDLVLNNNPNEINRQDTILKQTPIMMAVSLDNKKAFAYLLDMGANLKIINEDKEDVIDLSLANACQGCTYLIETKQKQDEITPLPNFASTFTAPDPIWLPYSTVKKTTKKKTTRNPNDIVIQGDSIKVPTYKQMPDILPLKKENGPNLVISED